VTRVLTIGLDCLPASILEAPLSATMPTVARLAREGLSGRLESTLPPITVPAWTSMMSGRDPGELGLYGFRNRRSYHYDDMVYASSQTVRYPRIWDYLTRAGEPSIVVGMPQTSPPPPIKGVLVCGFEGPLGDGQYTHPPHLRERVEDTVGDYLFDVPEFRLAALDDVIATTYLMTERRFRLARRLLAEEPWRFAAVHEIGPDRMHHCFWRFHDPLHLRHEPTSPYRHAIVDYYRYLDGEVAELLDAVGDDTSVLVASDHGAVAMHGGIRVNEILRQAGLLTLHEEPTGDTPFTPDLVDWSRTSAWAAGGYYARVFLNLAGREHEGVVLPAERRGVTARIVQLLSTIALDDGRVLRNRVHEPRELYARVRGLPPDLLVFFENESWRSVSGVGGGARHVTANDTGADDANHSRAGMYTLRASGGEPGRRRDASILDIAPTLLGLLGHPPERGLTGTDLLAA
jgi:predicted AlkP superfamily phosphohydrolase/phosphomutase